MMRRAAAVRLDIDERELKVGLRVIRDPAPRSEVKFSSPTVWKTVQATAPI